jgi:hypothetical protein
LTTALSESLPDHHPAPPPEAPRELTPAVRKGAWRERRVRVWWLLGVALLAICVYYAVSRLYFWNVERRLITQGVALQAQVRGWDGGEAPKGKVLAPDSSVELSYTYQGKEHRVFGGLAGRKEQIITRTNVPIFIDPAEPERWTGRTEPGSLAHEMLAAMLLAPGVIVLFALALWQRRRVLRTWHQGQTVLAEVVKVGHSAAAPASRLLSCALHNDRGDARVVKTLLPASKAPTVGDSLWLIFPPGRPQDAIPAALFE